MQIATKSGFEVLKEHNGHNLTTIVHYEGEDVVEIGVELFCKTCNVRVFFTQKERNRMSPLPEFTTTTGWDANHKGWETE